MKARFNMAKTNAERLREFKARKKEQEKVASVTLHGVFEAPFFEYFGDNPFVSEFQMSLDIAGIPMPEFEDDRGPRPFALDGVLDVDAPEYSDEVRSLGRAEVMLGAMIDAARCLADMLNDYKRQEIKARLAEIEASDLSKPEAKKAALKEAARLNKMLDQLDKQVRHTFPQWKVTG